jgi:hypothetical protein
MKPSQGHSLYFEFVRLAVLGLCWVAASPATAQIFQTGFEDPDYQGSAQGVVVTGQQGWYVPNVMGSTDQLVFTYDSNALGLPTNAFGELQFLGAQVTSSNLPRAQLDFDWSTGSVWTVSYDFAAAFNGTPPAVDYVGSFSLQDSLVARYFIAVNPWMPGFEGSQWAAAYIVFDASGGQIGPLVPGPQWLNLAVNHWYRESTTFDFNSNGITAVSITDLDTGDTATFAPTNWYLAGGAGGGGLPLPTGLRFFVGGDTNPGNVLGWDNVLVAGGAGAATPKNEESAHSLSIPLRPGAATY